MSVEETFGQALAHQQAGRLADAENLYRQLLKRDPRHAGAQVNLGNIYKDQGKMDDAAACYTAALAAAPSSIEALNNLGLVMHAKGQLADAALCYERAFNIRPLAEIINNLGNVLRQQGKADDAARCYTQAIALKPGFAQAHNNLGTYMNNQERLEEAVASYTRALALAPNFAEAHNNLGNTLKKQGKLEEAVDSYKRALALRPDMVEAHYSLGNALFSLGQQEDALVHLNRCLQLDPTDTHGAKLLLAGLGAAALPERAPDAQMQRLYRERARVWNDTDAYKGHEIVAHLLSTLHDGGNLDILDAGCGTGLVGDMVRQQARKLDGIDLSQPMLDKARDKNIYDSLHHGDMISFFNQHPAKYDVITCAATLIHFGDLRQPLTAASVTLRGKGLFIFTLFPHHGQEDVAAASLEGGLAQGGCYAHNPAYVRRLAEELGYTVAHLDTATHEYKKGEAVQGLLVALRR